MKYQENTKNQIKINKKKITKNIYLKKTLGENVSINFSLVGGEKRK